VNGLSAWGDWYRQIAEYSASAELDFLKREALETRAAGKLKGLRVRRTTPQFWDRFDALPKRVQQLVRENFALLEREQAHPSLHFNKVGEYLSARVGRSYRTGAVRCMH
jgi:hypothetical protein